MTEGVERNSFREEIIYHINDKISEQLVEFNNGTCSMHNANGFKYFAEKTRNLQVVMFNFTLNYSPTQNVLPDSYFETLFINNPKISTLQILINDYEPTENILKLINIHCKHIKDIEIWNIKDTIQNKT